jgi:hypothetical protein
MAYSRKALRTVIRYDAPPALAHYHNVDVKAWKASDETLKCDNLGSKRPRILATAGPPRCDKTEREMSFGHPVQ